MVAVKCNISNFIEHFDKYEENHFVRRRKENPLVTMSAPARERSVGVLLPFNAKFMR